MIPTPTPLAVVGLIKDIITNKVVCDIGCGRGELLQEMSRYAKKVIGIELEEENAKFAHEQPYLCPVEIYCQDSFIEPLPEADVYYSWTRDSMGVYLKAKEEGTTGVFIFGPSIRPSLVAFYKKLDAEIRELPGDDFWKVYICVLSKGR